jgi:hypothetical protein
MTGILKQLSAKSIANVATDNYEVEAAKILHLNDQIDRATQAFNIVSEYDRKLADGWQPVTQFDRNAYQQSMESASALTYDFMQLDIGYSAEASDKPPSVLKRLWEWIKAAVGNLMKMIRNLFGMRKTKFISCATDFEEIIKAAGRVTSAKPTPFDKGKSPQAEWIFDDSGKWVGAGEMNTAVTRSKAAQDGIASNIEKLVGFNASSIQPVKNKVETGGIIREKLGYKSEFDLVSPLKVAVDISIVRIEGRSDSKARVYSGEVLSIGDIKAGCKVGLDAAKALADGTTSVINSLKKFDDRINAIKDKNYSSLGDAHYDSLMKRMAGGQKNYDQMQHDANVFNALTLMINTHFKAIREVDMITYRYLGNMRHFFHQNVQRYKEDAE